MPPEQRVTRKLRAILSADVKGYSILMADDEIFTIKTIKEYRGIMSLCIEQHNGRVVDSPGDNMLAEFASAVDAVQCAVEMQKQLKKENDRLVEDKRLEFRIGVNIGDVVQDENRIYGDGVNIAARIEGLADPAGICVSRSAYDQIKNKMGFGFEYLGEHSVKNISEPVRVYKVLMDSESPVPLVDEELELPDKPSIAVLPFVNMSGDTSQEYFSDGLTEQIINSLCKVSNLFVIARNSSFAYKGRSISIKQIANELGVKYILEGSVQKAGDRVRVTAQLIDATTDYHMWSENYDRKLQDIFTMQDEITMKIINAMEVSLTFGEQSRLWKPMTNKIEALDCFMKGFQCFNRQNKIDNAIAQTFLKRALEIDSSYALAYAFLGFTYMNDLMYGWKDSLLEVFEQLDRCANMALDLDPSLDLAHCVSGFILLVKKQHAEAIKAIRRAIELNPNGDMSYVVYSVILSFSGEYEKAIPFIKRAFRLNPFPPPVYYHFFAVVYRNNEQYEKAIEICKKALRIEYDAIMPHLTLTSSYCLLNRLNDAKKHAKEVLRIDPNFSLGYYSGTLAFKDPDHVNKIINALRKAGLPE